MSRGRNANAADRILARVAAASLLLSGVLSILTGASFGLVARAIHRRPTTAAAVRARRAHATWWGALGAYLVLQGALTAAAAYDALGSDAYLASRALAIPLLCAATWGITSYLLYLYTGRSGSFAWVGAFYGLVALVFAYATITGPRSLQVDEWNIGLDDSGLIYLLVYPLVGVPPIVASLAYLGLLRRIEDPAQRYRIVLTAGSILLYVGSGLAARLASTDGLFFVVLVAFGLGAAAASLAAYYPPRPVREALGRR